MELWILYVWIASIMFVSGQACLKMSKDDAIVSCCYFTMSMGIIGLLTLMFITHRKGELVISKYGILAGILFFFGNLLWIKSIKTGVRLSFIRTMMAGSETLLLILLGYVLFNERTMSIYKLMGMTLVLSGVYLIGV